MAEGIAFGWHRCRCFVWKCCIPCDDLDVHQFNLIYVTLLLYLQYFVLASDQNRSGLWVIKVVLYSSYSMLIMFDHTDEKWEYFKWDQWIRPIIHCFIQTCCWSDEISTSLKLDTGIHLDISVKHTFRLSTVSRVVTVLFKTVVIQWPRKWRREETIQCIVKVCLLSTVIYCFNIQGARWFMYYMVLYSIISTLITRWWIWMIIFVLIQKGRLHYRHAHQYVQTCISLWQHFIIRLPHISCTTCCLFSTSCGIHATKYWGCNATEGVSVWICTFPTEVFNDRRLLGQQSWFWSAQSNCAVSYVYSRGKIVSNKIWLRCDKGSWLRLRKDWLSLIQKQILIVDLWWEGDPSLVNQSWTCSVTGWPVVSVVIS